MVFYEIAEFRRSISEFLATVTKLVRSHFFLFSKNVSLFLVQSEWRRNICVLSIHPVAFVCWTSTVFWSPIKKVLLVNEYMVSTGRILKKIFFLLCLQRFRESFIFGHTCSDFRRMKPQNGERNFNILTTTLYIGIYTFIHLKIADNTLRMHTL